MSAGNKRPDHRDCGYSRISATRRNATRQCQRKRAAFQTTVTFLFLYEYEYDSEYINNSKKSACNNRDTESRCHFDFFKERHVAGLGRIEPVRRIERQAAHDELTEIDEVNVKLALVGF